MRHSGLIGAFVFGSLALLSGCTVFPHNDVMLFGTDSQVAVDVSANPEQNNVPHISIGYKRREFVWMPLFPNAQHSLVGALLRDRDTLVTPDGSKITAPDDNHIDLQPGITEAVPAGTKVTISDGTVISFPKGTQVLIPGKNRLTIAKKGVASLPAGTEIALAQGSLLDAPGRTRGVDISSAKYIGVGPGKTGGVESDTYSVIASFGANIDAGATTAREGIAQFFATGIAARRLAEQGGASIVSTKAAAPRTFPLARDVESSTLEYFVAHSIKVAEIKACRNKMVGEQVDLSDFIQMPDYATQRAKCVQEVFSQHGGQ